MQTMRRQEVLAALDQLGISATGVYKVEIDVEEIKVYRYETNGEGRFMCIPGTHKIAEKVDIVNIIP